MTNKTQEDWEKVYDNTFSMAIDAGTKTKVVSKDIKELINKALTTREQEVSSIYKDFIAYCSCGDGLERKALYPDEATYYCFGCDKTFTLQLRDKKSLNKFFCTRHSLNHGQRYQSCAPRRKEIAS